MIKGVGGRSSELAINYKGGACLHVNKFGKRARPFELILRCILIMNSDKKKGSRD